MRKRDWIAGLAAVLLVVGALVALGATVSPAKVSPQAKTTMYFGVDTFGHAAADTLTWAKARGFEDSSYTVAAFATPITVTQLMQYAVVDDSSVAFFSYPESTAADSLHTYSYCVMLQKH